MSFLPYRTGAIFFPLKNHNNFAAEAAFLCRIVTVVTRFLHSLALARKERSDGIAIVRCKRNRVNDIEGGRLSPGRKHVFAKVAANTVKKKRGDCPASCYGLNTYLFSESPS